MRCSSFLLFRLICIELRSYPMQPFIEGDLASYQNLTYAKANFIEVQKNPPSTGYQIMTAMFKLIQNTK